MLVLLVNNQRDAAFVLLGFIITLHVSGAVRVHLQE